MANYHGNYHIYHAVRSYQPLPVPVYHMVITMLPCDHGGGASCYRAFTTAIYHPWAGAFFLAKRNGPAGPAVAQ